jgi:hypothetical protein
MMIERRKAARSRCLLGARVVFNSRSSTMSCSVRNYTEDGALLIFGEMPYIPDLLEVVLDNRKTLVPTQIAWRKHTKVGVIFPRGQFMAEMKQDAAANLLAMHERSAEASLH